MTKRTDAVRPQFGTIQVSTNAQRARTQVTHRRRQIEWRQRKNHHRTHYREQEEVQEKALDHRACNTGGSRTSNRSIRTSAANNTSRGGRTVHREPLRQHRRKDGVHNHAGQHDQSRDRSRDRGIICREIDTLQLLGDEQCCTRNRQRSGQMRDYSKDNEARGDRDQGRR